MNKYLSALQVLSKIGRVLSEVVFICCIVGGAGCVIGILSMTFLPNLLLQIGGINIWGIIPSGSSLSGEAMIATMSMGILACAGEAVLSKFANIFFKNEIKAGTPFTMPVAKEMLRLGILAICIPAGISIIQGILYGVMKIMDIAVSEMDTFSASSIGLGIMFIIISVILKCAITMNSRDIAEEVYIAESEE